MLAYAAVNWLQDRDADRLQEIRPTLLKDGKWKDRSIEAIPKHDITERFEPDVQDSLPASVQHDSKFPEVVPAPSVLVPIRSAQAWIVLARNLLVFESADSAQPAIDSLGIGTIVQGKTVPAKDMLHHDRVYACR